MTDLEVAVWVCRNWYGDLMVAVVPPIWEDGLWRGPMAGTLPASMDVRFSLRPGEAIKLVQAGDILRGDNPHD